MTLRSQCLSVVRVCMTFLQCCMRLCRCWLHLCPFVAVHASLGCWGACSHCGKTAGFVSRTELRAALERVPPCP